MSGVIDIRTQALEDLAQWGLWCRGRQLPGCYSQQPFYSEPEGFREDSTPTDILGNPLIITDEFAVKIDLSIASLSGLDPLYPSIAMMRFIAGLTIRDISSKTSINKDKVNSILGEIVVWVAGRAQQTAA